jgi:hypothetical protein
MKRWPVSHIRAVLLHELRHVKRGDTLIQPAARAICDIKLKKAWTEMKGNT